MVAEVQAKGSAVVLCTQVERRHFLDGGELEESLEDYPEVVREIALELQLPVIDLNAWTRELYTGLDEDQSKLLFCHFAAGEHAHWPEGLADNTHFHECGARRVAEYVAGQLALRGYGAREDLRSGVAAR